MGRGLGRGAGCCRCGGCGEDNCCTCSDHPGITAEAKRSKCCAITTIISEMVALFVNCGCMCAGCACCVMGSCPCFLLYFPGVTSLLGAAFGPSCCSKKKCGQRFFFGFETISVVLRIVCIATFVSLITRYEKELDDFDKCEKNTEFASALVNANVCTGHHECDAASYCSVSFDWSQCMQGECRDGDNGDWGNCCTSRGSDVVSCGSGNLAFVGSNCGGSFAQDYCCTSGTVLTYPSVGTCKDCTSHDGCDDVPFGGVCPKRCDDDDWGIFETTDCEKSELTTVEDENTLRHIVGGLKAILVVTILWLVFSLVAMFLSAAAYRAEANGGSKVVAAEIPVAGEMPVVTGQVVAEQPYAK